MIKAIVTASAFTLAIVSGAYAQSSTGTMQNDTNMTAPATTNNNSGTATNPSTVDQGTTGSVDGTNKAQGGGADGSSQTCNGMKSGKNTGNGTPEQGSTTNC